MSTSVNLCPCCDKALEPNTTHCPQCGQAVTVSGTSLATMDMATVGKYLAGYNKALATDPGNQEVSGYAAMCFLKMRLYDKAMPLFEKAIDNNYTAAEPYFMAAICLLRGKKPFLAQRADIDRAVEYLNAANMIAPNGLYYQLLGYIKQDYFDRKYLSVSPTSKEDYARAAEMGVMESDVQALNSLLGLQ